MSHYTLRCRACGATGVQGFCPGAHCGNSLLVTQYAHHEFVECGAEGLWRFNWLPVHMPRFPQQSPLVYRSEGLAAHMGLRQLYIAFSGFWPERGACLSTCTFKELEAAVVLQNAIENGLSSLVVASAGNTARAFAHLSDEAEFPVVIVVPRMCLSEMWHPRLPRRAPTLVLGDGDYSDAIDTAKRISQLIGAPFEGGVQNAAKRDGLGATLLEAVSRIGRLPDHYFQAVGSGAGGIGVWETAERFLADGRFGSVLPRLHLAQNMPFAPMAHAWRRGSRTLDRNDLDPALIGGITTRVLSSRYPAYGIVGGVYDALTACGGDMYGVANEEVYAAMDLFLETEGIDIVPAAGVAVAALLQAVRAKRVDREDLVLVNITGGGEKKYRERHTTHEIFPHYLSKKYTDNELKELLWPLLNTA